MNRYRYALVAALVLSAATLTAQQGGRGGPQAPQVSSPEVSADRRISFRIYAPQAREVRLNAGDIPGARPELGADQGRQRRLGADAPAAGLRRVSLHLQRRRRGDDRSAQPGDQRVEQQRLEPGLRAGLGSVRLEERRARRRCRDHLQVVHARTRSPDARLHAAGLRERPRPLPGVLSAARRRRQRRLVVHRRPRRLHPRQSDRDAEGEADGGGDARRPHVARPTPTPSAAAPPTSSSATSSPT